MMPSTRAGHVIEITGDQIPVGSGSQIYRGFVALVKCDGKPYQKFRDMAGGPAEAVGRRFSPSKVIKTAEELGFARLIAPSPTETRNKTAVYANMTDTGTSTGGSDGPVSLATDRRGLLARKMRWAETPNVDMSKPGIYAWEIDGIGVYVGRYTKSTRPLQDYDRNVSRYLSGLPYRPGNPDGYRTIHRALAQAVRSGRKITLRLVENCAPEELNLREVHWIGKIAWGNLNG